MKAKWCVPLVAVILFASVGCDRPISRKDATGIAEDMADSYASQVEVRVIGLEQKVDQLETSERLLEQYAESLKAVLDEERENRKAEVKGLRDHYNDHLTKWHGATR